MHRLCIILAECGSICTHLAPDSTDIDPINFGRIRHGTVSARCPAAAIGANNPMGTDGFEFVEYAHPNPEELHALFRLMGYAPVARHRTKKITVYRQGDMNYLVNEEPGTHGHDFVAAHGPCAPSMAFRVVDAKQAYERALVARRGAGR